MLALQFVDADVVNGQTIPAPAARVGYTDNAFSSNFTSSTVDTKLTKKSGFLWYNWELFGHRSDPSAVELNSDNSVTLYGDSTRASGQLVTAVQVPGSRSFVGNSFSGGAYIEAELKFDPDSVSSASKDLGWPAFWALALEGNVPPYSNQWKGQASGFVHGIETDFFEAIRNPVGIPKNSYGGTMHDWYGIYKKTCPSGLCRAPVPYVTGMRIVPEGTDFTQYHWYGFLWVPATAKIPGYAKFFFDREQIGSTQEWTTLGDQPPPPDNQPWAFGILDRQHLFLILGTGKGEPMTVRQVSVWQGSSASNLVH